MAREHVGYLEFDGRFVRLQTARCCFSKGQLDAEAEGPKCKVHLYGIPFPEAAGMADLRGRTSSPDPRIVRDDPIAEGGIETREMWLSYRTLTVLCRSFDPKAALITVAFQAEVEDSESGRRGSVDCTVRCLVVESLW